MAGDWAVAAREGYMIYMRGPYAGSGVASDFMWRLLDYVIFATSTLIQLVQTPGLCPMVFTQKVGVTQCASLKPPQWLSVQELDCPGCVYGTLDPRCCV
jgi:hypothetical protein